MININNKWRVRWDLIVMVLSIYNSYTAPIEIAFNPPSYQTKTFTNVNWIIDSFFWLDIIINFRTSYINTMTGDEVIKPKKVAINYL